MRTRRKKVVITIEFNWLHEIRALDNALLEAQRCLAKEGDFEHINDLSFLRNLLRQHLPERTIVGGAVIELPKNDSLAEKQV